MQSSFPRALSGNPGVFFRNGTFAYEDVVDSLYEHAGMTSTLNNVIPERVLQASKGVLLVEQGVDEYAVDPG
jgi:hypothetical protein